MNLTNTPHLQVPGQANAPSSDVLANLGQRLNLDPEALKLLEQSSVENGVDFGKVLEATKNGNDPEAVIELLKAEGEGAKGNTADTSKPQLSNNPESQNTLTNEQIVERAPLENNSNQPTELNSILNKSSQKGDAKLVANDVQKTAQTPELMQKNAIDKSNIDVFKNQNNQITENMIAQKSTAQKTILNNQAGTASNIENKNLVKLDEFMSKQSPTMRMNSAKKAYNPVSKSMFAKKVDASLPGVTKINSEQKKLQDIMFSQSESGSNLENAFEGSQGETIQSVAKISNKPDAQNITKVFDINTLSKTDSTNEVITKVQDYIIQTKAGNTPELEVSFKHEDLGKVDLLVQKDHGDKIRLTIGTNTKDAAKFFTQHQRDLLSTLNNSGIQISDFKLDSSSLSSNNQNSSSDGSPKDQLARGNGNQQHNSQNGQRDQESRKRSSLWEQFNKEAA